MALTPPRAVSGSLIVCKFFFICINIYIIYVKTRKASNLKKKKTLVIKEK